MEILKENGYEPIYYSYKPFTLNNIYYEQILEKFPISLWIAGYGLNDGNADLSIFLAWMVSVGGNTLQIRMTKTLFY